MSTVSTTVNVSGMTCGHCVSAVSEELRRSPASKRSTSTSMRAASPRSPLPPPRDSPRPKSGRQWLKPATSWSRTRPETRTPGAEERNQEPK